MFWICVQLLFKVLTMLVVRVTNLLYVHKKTVLLKITYIIIVLKFLGTVVNMKNK